MAFAAEALLAERQFRRLKSTLNKPKSFKNFDLVLLGQQFPKG
jgi:hypothetical protein